MVNREEEHSACTRSDLGGAPAPVASTITATGCPWCNVLMATSTHSGRPKLRNERGATAGAHAAPRGSDVASQCMLHTKMHALLAAAVESKREEGRQVRSAGSMVMGASAVTDTDG